MKKEMMDWLQSCIWHFILSSLNLSSLGILKDIFLPFISNKKMLNLDTFFLTDKFPYQRSFCVFVSVLFGTEERRRKKFSFSHAKLCNLLLFDDCAIWKWWEENLLLLYRKNNTEWKRNKKNVKIVDKKSWVCVHERKKMFCLNK